MVVMGNKPQKTKLPKRLWTGVRITPEAKALLEAIKQRLALRSGPVLELCIREFAVRHGVASPCLGDTPTTGRVASQDAPET